MEEKKIVKLNEQELDMVSGGADSGSTEVKKLEICPNCRCTLLQYRFERINDIQRYISHCTDCHHAFFFNEASEMVSLGQYC